MQLCQSSFVSKIKSSTSFLSPKIKAKQESNNHYKSDSEIILLGLWAHE